MVLFSLQFSLFTAIHKHYSIHQWQEFASQNPDCLEVTLGLPCSLVFQESFFFWGGGALGIQPSLLATYYLISDAMPRVV